MRSPGFTIIELVAVMAVIAVSMLVMMPKIGEIAAKPDADIAFFNALIDEHYKEAVRIKAPVVITGFKGSANILKYNGSRVSIPGVGAVSSARINGHNTYGLEYHIYVYPDGICDYFELNTGKEVITSFPLSLKVAKGDS